MTRFLPGLMLLAGVAASAQTPTPANAVKVTKLIFSVANLDKSVAFYRALGLRIQGQVGQPQPVPPFVAQMVDVPKGTRFRNAMLNFPGADIALELTEFSGMELRPGKPRIQDPGAALLIVVVRNIDGALEHVKGAAATVVTPGGAPLRNESKGRAVMVRDPDGFYVAIVQPDDLPAGSDAVVSARWATTVEDAGKTAAYVGQLGFETKLSKWDGEDPALKAFGTPGSQYRARSAQVPDFSLRWSFYEWKDIDRKPVKLRIPDPGSPAIGVEVRDLDAAVAAIKAAGGSGITPGGSIQLPGAGGKLGFVRDPGGVLIELAQPAAK
jgi:catechol 2,3-dioxygenase-like lactoylglutathione lyase family enzyme